MARAGHRAVGGDRAAGGPGSGRAAGPWGEGVSGQSQGRGPGAGSVPPERGQGRPVRCPGPGRFLRTDPAPLLVLEPCSEAAQELKLLTEDYQRQVRTQTRLVNQLTATVEVYYTRALRSGE